MRYVKASELKAGMKVASDIKGIAGKTIIGASTVLNDRFISRINEDGYMGIFVNDDYGIGIEIDDSFTAPKYSEGLDAVTELDFQKLNRIAISIVDSFVRRPPDRIDIHNVCSFSEYLYYHSVNVAIYSVAIGQELGLDREGLYYLSKAAIFHDIGMVEIPFSVRNKADFSAEDRALLRRHVENAERLLRSNFVDELIIDAVLAHHENENGSGYPYKLESDDIPDFAKIIHVADVLDEMTQRHNGKSGYLPADVFDYLSSGAGILFHEAVVDACTKAINAYPVGNEVFLSDGRAAIIIGKTADNLRPAILIKDTGEKIRLSDNVAYKDVSIKSSALGKSDVDESIAIDKDSPESSSSALSINDKPKEKPVVVVVDDVFICRRTVEVALQNEFKVVTFENAIMAISYISRNKVDLVIMDIEMPELDGMSAVRQLRNSGYTDLPVIFLTSINDRETVMNCVNVGAKDYILKPIKQIYVYERAKEAVGSTK